MEGFLNILRKLTGTAKENRPSGSYKDSSSPTGERYIDTTKGLIESFDYADNNRAKEVNDMLESGTYVNLLGIKVPDKQGSNTAKTATSMGTNRMDYVPFVYTTTSDANEPLKYGYIMRYAGDSSGLFERGPNKIYGVTTDTKSYTADGAKKFFDKIKENGGLVRLYSEPMKDNYINEGTKTVQKLSDVKRPSNRNTNFRKGTSGSYLQPGLIEALREANRLTKEGWE